MVIVATKKHYFFYRDCELSQFWKCSFEDENGVRFSSAEQYMHYRKAVLFGDDERADTILGHGAPLLCKRIGRLVKGYDSRIWDKEKVGIVREGTRLKFSQNGSLMAALLRSGDRKIVEASPSDRIWGIGMSVGSPGINDEKKWKGQNLLGEILTEFRDSCREKKDDE